MIIKNYKGVRKYVKENICSEDYEKDEIDEVVDAVDNYISDHGGYPFDTATVSDFDDDILGNYY